MKASNNLKLQNETAKKTKKEISKGKLAAIIICIIAALSIIGSLVYYLVIEPANKYNTAITMKENGDMESAYDIFLELGDYKDSKAQCDEYNYSQAVSLYYDKGKFAKCYQELANIEGYAPAEELSNKIKADYPYVEALTAEAGTIITLGEYEQDNDSSNGREPIEWIVLGNKDNNVLLISKYILDAQPFNMKNSIECTLDDWLIDSFFARAFSNEKIDENILYPTLFLKDDKDLYFSNNDYSLTSPTEYAKNIETYQKVPEAGVNSDKVYSYWLLGDVFGSGGHANANVGLETGINANCAPVQQIYGVRPALWICPNGEADFPKAIEYSGEIIISEAHSSEPCINCNGTGYVRFYYGESELEAILSGHDDYTVGKCPMCDGKGKVEK